MFRAVTDQNLDYRRLKTIARDSLEHSFLAGDSLWATVATAESGGRVCARCDGLSPAGSTTGRVRRVPRRQRPRRRLQSELERRFHVFEASQ